jgi:hypothetical protein
MTLEQAGHDYYISLDYNYKDKDNISKDGWSWFIDCGYQSFWSHESYKTANEAEMNLIKFLETWEGPTK